MTLKLIFGRLFVTPLKGGGGGTRHSVFIQVVSLVVTWMISYIHHAVNETQVRRKILTRITNRFTAASWTQFYLWCFTQRLYNYRFSQLFYKSYSCNFIFTYTFVYSKKKRNYTRRGMVINNIKTKYFYNQPVSVEIVNERLSIKLPT